MHHLFYNYIENFQLIFRLNPEIEKRDGVINPEVILAWLHREFKTIEEESFIKYSKKEKWSKSLENMLRVSFVFVPNLLFYQHISALRNSFFINLKDEHSRVLD